MGIEPTRDDTRLSSGFEDRGGHQYPIQPRFFDKHYYKTKTETFQGNHIISNSNPFHYYPEREGSL